MNVPVDSNEQYWLVFNRNREPLDDDQYCDRREHLSGKLDYTCTVAFSLSTIRTCQYPPISTWPFQSSFCFHGREYRYAVVSSDLCIFWRDQNRWCAPISHGQNLPSTIIIIKWLVRDKPDWLSFPNQLKSCPVWYLCGWNSWRGHIQLYWSSTNLHMIQPNAVFFSRFSFLNYPIPLFPLDLRTDLQVLFGRYSGHLIFFNTF